MPSDEKRAAGEVGTPGRATLEECNEKMTYQQPIRNSVALLRNVVRFNQLIDRVQNRGPDLPGMACFYGPSGYGKTTAALWNANETNAYQVQVKSVWSRKHLAEAITRELGLPPGRTIAIMVDQIAEELMKTGRPLIIDEADYLMSPSMIEMIRDIYEGSQAAVILIGEERLPQKLAKWERVHGRMLDWVGAQPLDLREVGLLAEIYCPGVDLDDGLKGAVLQASNGSARRVCVNLSLLAEMARTKGVAALSSKDMSKSFFTGNPPPPRKF